MIEGAGDKLEVARLAQQLGREVVAHVVKPEALDARALAHRRPFRPRARVGDREAFALLMAFFGPPANMLEDRFGMMALQRLQDGRYGLSDRC